MDYLPMAAYDSPPRQVRGRKLNTIMEDHEETNFGMRSESETDTSEGTIIGRPLAGDSTYFIAAPKKSRLGTSTMSSELLSLYSDCSVSPCSSAESGVNRKSTYSSAGESDDGTVFSDTCPSLGGSAASDPTTFATDSDSSRNSLVSTKSGRNRYPALLIPRSDAWSVMENAIKENAVRMSPAPKIPLSPAVLSALPKWVPALHAPPSLGDGSSVTSESPSVVGISAPVTPDMRVIQVVESENWGAHHQTRHGRGGTPVREDAEEMHRREPQSAIIERDPESDWSDIVGKFPQIPGATPEENSPITPDIEGRMVFPNQPSSEDGIWLPPDALRTLENLIRERSPATISEGSMKDSGEMQEVSVPPSRPRSLDGATPCSNYSGYSFSQLSIPSPGGFFSSLKAGTRHTWCPGQPKISNPPSSTTAENFYNVPWHQPDRTVETVLEVDDSHFTDGPPTARQADFHLTHPRSRSHSNTSSEDTDMYGHPVSKTKTPTQSQHPRKASPIRYEYEEAYEDEIKQTAEQNIDRTSTWLAAQTTYMSALRESNPLNDLSDPSAPTVHPSTHTQRQSQPEALPARKTVHFRFDPSASPASFIIQTSTPKDSTLLKALTHHITTRKRIDPFIHATTRLDLIHSLRLTQQSAHIDHLLGKFSNTPSHSRPKYSGPFSQNPRQTGIFDLTPAQAAYRSVEREQHALSQLKSNAWAVDGLRYLQSGRLLASQAACRRLTTRATLPLDDPKCIGKKRLRVLDLGGIAACDWAWQVANRWPNVKVYTVLTKSMAETQLANPSQVQSQNPETLADPNAIPTSIASPPNHRTISVPHLWALPFRDNHFDIVSARSLHALLKAEPVPGVKSIDEYDMTLKEVMRVLKPGGWFEFVVMDSAIVRPQMPSADQPQGKPDPRPASGNGAGTATAGSRGDAMSVEFGFQLKMRGYEREATRSWLPRLRRLGFSGVKRAWVFLPMGNPLGSSILSLTAKERDGGKVWKEAPRPISEVSVRKIIEGYMDVEAVRGPVGGTREVADVCGLVAGSMWEGWVVKMRRECGREEGRVAEGLAEVVKEARDGGAGVRVLIGWGRKPSRGSCANRVSGMTEIGNGMMLQRGDAEMGTIRVKMGRQGL